MPIHDWTRVIPGVFHDFHHEWISTIKRALNGGILPEGYYALAEQIAGGLGPDVLALEAAAEIDLLTKRQKRIAIRHRSGHEVIAVIEIVSPGNKSSKPALRSFVQKAIELLDAGIHLSVIDLFPRGKRDPQGIHAAIWTEIEEDDEFELPPDKPMTLVSYSAGLVKEAFIEPIALGDSLPDLALFIKPGQHVLVPLESTYQAAWEGVPAIWRKELA